MPLLDNIVTGGVRMAKYISKSARKRIPMTSKMGNKNYYKGKGGTKEGTLNSKGAPAFLCVTLLAVRQQSATCSLNSLAFLRLVSILLATISA